MLCWPAVAVTPDVRDAIAGWLGAVGTRQEDRRGAETGDWLCCHGLDCVPRGISAESRQRPVLARGVREGFAESGLRDKETEASRYEHRTAWDTWVPCRVR